MDRFWHRFACALLIMLGCAMGVAAQSPADDQAADSNTRGKITGHVVNEGGQPLPNVAVTVRGYGASEVRTTVATDGEGNFEVADLPPIAYLVSARTLAYVARPRDPDMNPVGYYRIGDSVRLEMMKGGVITGIVKRSNGEPVVSVAVRAYLVRDYKGQRPAFSTPSLDVRTDDRGVYRIYGLAPLQLGDESSHLRAKDWHVRSFTSRRLKRTSGKMCCATLRRSLPRMERLL